MFEVKGYKAFNKDATNRYGKPFTEGETYFVEGPVSFGNNGNGYHMCTALSDVFRYVNAMTEEALVAEVTGSGSHVKMDDEYYGYYDMYAVERITIDKFLTRDEIIDKMLNSSPFQVRKFLSTFGLSEEEKILFVKKFRNDREILKCLLYYHFGCKQIYEQNYVKGDKQIRMVLKYGQDNNKGSKRK